MQFILCSDATYQDLYEWEYYKYPRIYEWTTLLGFMGTDGKGITVLVHEDEISTALDEGADEDIEVQLNVLADIRNINLVYVDEDGRQHKHYPPEIEAETSDI